MSEGNGAEQSAADNAAANAAGYGSDTVGAGAMDGLSSAGMGFAAETIGTSVEAYDLTSQVNEVTSGLAGFMDSLGIHAASMSTMDLGGYGVGGNDTGGSFGSAIGGWQGSIWGVITRADGYQYVNSPDSNAGGG